ncbi:MAG TPA: branched-chain amino acid ABC transporter permease [Actinomycetota bacterium]|nr:branched-chain amino acid ABC transporter permease [Actinomycetota bacterium]
MHLFVQACILGILIGGVYALMASGLTLIFGIMRVINVAQGAMVVLGAYLSYSLFTSLHIDPFVSILVIAPLMFGLGVTIHRLFIRSLRGNQAELSLLVTWATALAVEGALSLIYSTTFRSTITSYSGRSWTIGGYHISEVRAFGFVISVAILSGLYLLLARSRFGRSVRATVQNPTSARLLGVNADRVSALGFGIGVATAAAAGAVYGMIYPFNPGSHYDLISRLLSIVVLGGLGSMSGAIVAALILGVAESVVAVTISPVWASFVFFIVLISILLLRPQGLFGLRERAL